MRGLARDAQVLRGRQSGQALVEWMVISALALMAAIWAAGEFARQAELAAAKGHAQWLWTVGQAIETVMAQTEAGTTSAQQGFEGLPANTLVAAKPFLERMQASGWLLRALAAEPTLPYDVRLLKLDQPGACDANTCTQILLLLAVPKPGKSVPDASHLLLALQGKGLAITDLAPDYLRGAAFTLANPPTGNQRLPVGTVALLAWRHDREPPYVRLNESRQVTLAGGVLLGRLGEDEGACQPVGLVMLGPAGDLRVCKDGQWGTVSESHEHFQACLPQTREEAFRAAWLKYTEFWRLLGGGPNCDCAAGFAPIQAVGDRGRVGAVELRDGYLCQRL